jgi:hypothetical protein
LADITSKLSVLAIAREFAAGWVMDNSLCALSVRAGEKVLPEEIIELAAGAKALFLLATLACRLVDQIRECATLWKETLKVFREGLEVWGDARKWKNPLKRAYCRQLERLGALGRDRCELYGVSEVDRKAFVTAYRSDFDFDPRDSY